MVAWEYYAPQDIIRQYKPGCQCLRGAPMTNHTEGDIFVCLTNSSSFSLMSLHALASRFPCTVMRTRSAPASAHLITCGSQRKNQYMTNRAGQTMPNRTEFMEQRTFFAGACGINTISATGERRPRAAIDSKLCTSWHTADVQRCTGPHKIQQPASTSMV